MFPTGIKNKTWGNISHESFCDTINGVYDEIVHSAAMERRLNLWRQGDLDLLLKEVRFIQGKFVNSKRARTVEDISKVFAKLVFQGKLSAAIKLLDSESSRGLLNLTPEVLQGLKGKHPKAADIVNESLLYGSIDYIPPDALTWSTRKWSLMLQPKQRA